MQVKQTNLVVEASPFLRTKQDIIDTQTSKQQAKQNNSQFDQQFNDQAQQKFIQKYIQTSVFERLYSPGQNKKYKKNSLIHNRVMSKFNGQKVDYTDINFLQKVLYQRKFLQSVFHNSNLSEEQQKISQVGEANQIQPQGFEYKAKQWKDLFHSTNQEKTEEILKFGSKDYHPKFRKQDKALQGYNSSSKKEIEEEKTKDQFVTKNLDLNHLKFVMNQILSDKSQKLINFQRRKAGNTHLYSAKDVYLIKKTKKIDSLLRNNAQDPTSACYKIFNEEAQQKKQKSSRPSSAQVSFFQKGAQSHRNYTLEGKQTFGSTFLSKNQTRTSSPNLFENQYQNENRNDTIFQENEQILSEIKQLSCRQDLLQQFPSLQSKSISRSDQKKQEVRNYKVNIIKENSKDQHFDSQENQIQDIREEQISTPIQTEISILVQKQGKQKKIQHQYQKKQNEDQAKNEKDSTISDVDLTDYKFYFSNRNTNRRGMQEYELRNSFSKMRKKQKKFSRSGDQISPQSQEQRNNKQTQQYLQQSNKDNLNIQFPQTAKDFTYSIQSTNRSKFSQHNQNIQANLIRDSSKENLSVKQNQTFQQLKNQINLIQGGQNEFYSVTVENPPYDQHQKMKKKRVTEESQQEEVKTQHTGLQPSYKIINPQYNGKMFWTKNNNQQIIEKEQQKRKQFGISERNFTFQLGDQRANVYTKNRESKDYRQAQAQEEFIIRNSLQYQQQQQSLKKSNENSFEDNQKVINAPKKSPTSNTFSEDGIVYIQMPTDQSSFIQMEMEEKTKLGFNNIELKEQEHSPQLANIEMRRQQNQEARNQVKRIKMKMKQSQKQKAKKSLSKFTRKRMQL